LIRQTASNVRVSWLYFKFGRYGFWSKASSGDFVPYIPWDIFMSVKTIGNFPVKGIFRMIIDIGGGTTDIAVISLGGIVTGQSITVAGDVLDANITRYIRRHYNLMIGERTAEEIKIGLGSAYPLEKEIRYEVRGRDHISGLPKIIEVSSEEIREALKDSVAMIINAVRQPLKGPRRNWSPTLCSRRLS
jgi:MreB/Mrl family cell shape determining protein